MIDLLNKFCLDNTKDNGLFLLDMPTGIGKTYNVLKFIKNYLKQKESKRIFFITTLKKNLDDPYLDLMNDLSNDPELKDSIFRVLSNTEYLIENFDRVKDRIKSYEIRSSECFKQICALMATNSRKPELYTVPEKDFRRLISKLLSKKYRDKKQKISAIKNDKEWQWVGDLYPVVFSEEKKVFFLTMKKLINQYDTIVEKSVRLYESNIFRNSLVFIDEFDATKSDIQDAIVQNGLNKGIDYIDLFRNIKICLDNHETIPSNIWNNVDNKPNHKLALEKNIKLFDDIAKKYNLMQHHKSIDFEDKKVVLFSDFTHNNYTTGDENVIVDFDTNKNINNLRLVSKEKKNRSLYEALDRIKGAISYFARFVTILSNSYKKNKLKNRQDGKSYGEFTDNHALDTVLDSLHLQGESYRIIRDMAFTFSTRLKTKSKNGEDLRDDLSFYANGFSHYDFMDDYSHDNTTIIRKFVFEETPESILYTICRMSKVIGISATATYNTVLGNYDIDYLEWKLGDCYHKPSEEDKERLRKDFEKQTVGYENVNINVELTETSSKDAPNWAKIYKNDEELVNYANNNITEKYKSKDEYYKPIRYYKTVWAFKQFMENNMQSLLALFSKSLKPNDFDFDQNVLIQLIKNWAQDSGYEFKEDMFVVLDSENFEEKKKKLVDELSAGERRFVISTYATIGAGQNLQYKIPDYRKNDIVKINDMRNGDEMDFDGIYLDRPTNIINNYSDEEELAIHRVFQMEYLNEIKAISQEEKMSEITISYSNIGKEKDKFQNSKNKLYSKRDVKVCATKFIVQAMGRKCRTNCRGKKVYILADSELKNILDYDTLFNEGRMFNLEMVKLAEQFHIGQDQPEDNRFINNAIGTSLISNKRILQLLNRSFENSWNEDDIRLWNYMRKYVLQHPTLTADEWKKSPFRQHYITLGKPTNKYYYQQKGDFDTITRISEDNFDGASCVSHDDVNLKGIFNVWHDDAMQKLFIKEGYATEFKEADYIMSPPLYNNIYKGALGEKVGLEIFEFFKISLEELNSDEHEMFDYKVSEKPIYVDFKYWKETTLFDAETYHNKVMEKARKCQDIKTVVIANVRDTGHEEPSYKNQDGIEIIEISLICNGMLSQRAAREIQRWK